DRFSKFVAHCFEDIPFLSNDPRFLCCSHFQSSGMQSSSTSSYVGSSTWVPMSAGACVGTAGPPPLRPPTVTKSGRSLTPYLVGIDLLPSSTNGTTRSPRSILIFFTLSCSRSVAIAAPVVPLMYVNSEPSFASNKYTICCLAHGGR